MTDQDDESVHMPLTLDQIEALIEEVIDANAVWPDPLTSQVDAVMDVLREAIREVTARAERAEAMHAEAFRIAHDNQERLAAVEALAGMYDQSENWRTWGVPQAIRRAAFGVVTLPGLSTSGEAS